MATYEGIIATLTRITEAGDVRITEDGNARILTSEGESVVVSDIVTVVLTTQGIVAESVGVSDTVEVRATRNVSIEESASASDEVGVQWVAHGDVEESVDVADAVEVSWQAHVEIEESVSASDETVTNWQAHVEIEESATIDDSAVGVEQNYAYSPSSVAVSDTVEVVATHHYSLMTIEGNETFAVGDILRIKDGVHDEWLEVVTTADAPTYGVNRDKAGNYADGSNPEWKKGASVVNYGQAGDGAVYMTASEAHAPYLSIFTHEGEPWDTITTHIREGNLNGYAGYTSDTFGWASYINDNNFIKIDPTNGIRMSGEVTITGGNTTLDVIENGVTYGRVQTAVLDSGYLYLMRRNEDATEQLLVTASGIEGYANSVKNFELASGIAYLGDQSNEHIKLSSSGMQIYDGATLYATYGSVTTIGRTNYEHIYITSNRLRLMDGATVLTELTGGEVLVGQTDYEHISITSSSLRIKDGTTVLTEISGGNILVGQTGVGQSNVYITSGSISLRNNVTDVITISNTGVASITINDGGGITVKSGADITIEKGGDLNLAADPSSPSRIYLKGTNYTTVLGSELSDGSVVNLYGQTDNAVTLNLGLVGQRYFAINLYAKNEATLQAYYSANWRSFFSANATGTYFATSLYGTYNGTLYSAILYGSSTVKAFQPSPTSSIDLGGSSYKWKNLYFSGTIYGPTTTEIKGSGSGDNYLMITGTGSSSIGRLIAQYGGAFGTDRVEIAHNGSDGYVQAVLGRIYIYAGSTEVAVFNTDGSLDVNGAVTENAFSLDDKLVSENKWEYIEKINDAFINHDGKLLPTPLQVQTTFKEQKKDVIKYGKKPSDLIQVSVSCILDLERRIKILEGKQAI
ncbi:MAG: hypothetical protein PHH09_05870 [Methanoregulaceae archaeon]|nr:hypothetical protein [Methanoregulaceae archaeon]